MPPKSAKKKKGDGKDSGETAVQEELRHLKAKLLLLESQLTEERELSSCLNKQILAKDERIVELQVQARREQSKHAADSTASQEEAITVHNEVQHTVKSLEEKIALLQQDLAAYSIVEKENIFLRKRVEELRQELTQQTQAHSEDMAKTKKDMFNLRVQLEQTFRKTVQEMDEKYHRIAFDEMSSESKNALVANAKLKDELSMQSVGVESLLDRCTGLEAAYQKMKVEKDILENSNALQLKQIGLMKRQKNEFEARISDLQIALKMAQNKGNGSSSSLMVHQEDSEDRQAVREQLQKYVALHEKAQNRALKWKRRAMELTKQTLLASSCSNGTGTSEELLRLAGLESGTNSDAEGRPQTEQARVPDINLENYETIMAIWKSSSPRRNIGDAPALPPPKASNNFPWNLTGGNTSKPSSATASPKMAGIRRPQTCTPSLPSSATRSSALQTAGMGVMKKKGGSTMPTLAPASPTSLLSSQSSAI